MKKRILRILAGLLVLLLVLALLFNSSPRITSDDEKYITTFLKDWSLNEDKQRIHQDQSSQIRYISRIQDCVISQISHAPVPFDSAGNLRCYYNGRIGLCFDRALMIEKFLMHAGFTIRHIYTFYNFNGDPIYRKDFFKYGLTSHAMLEVKTKKGWMAVGTNSNWLGLGADSTVMTLFKVREKIRNNSLVMAKTPTVKKPFFTELANQGDFRILYGVYSRHGETLISRPLESWLHSAGIKCKIPDYNLRQLLYNL